MREPWPSARVRRPGLPGDHWRERHPTGIGVSGVQQQCASRGVVKRCTTAMSSPFAAESLSQFPAQLREIIHCLGKFIQSVLLADDLENNIAHSECFFYGVAQAFEVDYSGTDRVVTPDVRTCVGNMDQFNMLAVGEQGRDGLLLDLGGVGSGVT